MPLCLRKGCGQEYDERDNTETSCRYHSGGPVFHEGLKSWSCCSDTNRPVLDFDSFMAIAGCTEGCHSAEKPAVEAPTSGGIRTFASEVKADGVETFTTSLPPTFTVMNPSTQPIPPPPTLPEEEDDISVFVPVGTSCKHRGCNATFVSDEVSRGDGDGSTCTWHPGQPIFHEGSKGYLCCKRRVLEFEEFLKIQGCKTGKHVFAIKQDEKQPSEELIHCRIDHYQTPTQVHVSVFAKQTDKNSSRVELEDSKIHFDLLMPGNKRFRRTVELYGPIDPSASKYTFFGTKVEVVLTKADTRSWILLERTDQPVGAYNLTFGVGGKTGTIGAKEPILSEENKIKQN